MTPKGIKEAITLLLKLGDSWTNYPLHFYELTEKTSTLVFEDEKVSVSTIPLVHRVYTNGFVFRAKPNARKLNIDAITYYNIDKSQFNNIKAGKDVVLDNGETIANHLLTFDPPKPKSYAFCSDTKYNEAVVPIIKEVDVLYHESTFLESNSF